VIDLLLANGEVIRINVEEYLRAVVPGEMPSNWHPQALMAQAVAARSYAANTIEHPRHKEVSAHLCQPQPGLFVHCQAYDPQKINPRTDEAVYATRGIVMIYENSIVNALYHSDCGGHTLANEDVFHGTPLAYLRGVTCIKNNKEITQTYTIAGKKQLHFGHRVGLCQNGANWYAEFAGRSWEWILRHYYTGIEFCAYTECPKNNVSG